MRTKPLLLLVVLAMLLSACGGTTPTPETAATPAPGAQSAPGAQPTPAADQTTVLFAANEYEAATYTDLIKAFEKDNPGIKIKVVSTNEILGMGPLDTQVPDDYAQRLAAGADVIAASAGDQSWSDQGLIRDLTPFIDADTTFKADDFVPGALEQFQWKGGTWGVPTATEFQFIVFDKAVFDKAGVEYPQPGWTWDDFTAKAKALTVRDGDTTTQWGFIVPFTNHTRVIRERVPALIDHSTDPATPRFDQPDVRAVVQWYTDLYLKDKVMPYFPPVEGDLSLSNLPESYKLVQAGKAAMSTDSGISWQVRKQQTKTMSLAPLPVDKGNDRTSPLSVVGLLMSAGTTKPDAAWRWMSFLSQQAPPTIATFKQLPARRSVLESSGLLDKLDPEYAAALRFAIDHVLPLESTSIGPAFNDAIEAILKDGKPIDQALADAQTATEEYLAEAAQQAVEATPVPTVVVAAPQETPVSQNATTIKFSLGTALLHATAYRDLAKRFTEANPDIVVEVKQPDITNTSLDIPDVAKDVDCFMWAPSLQDPKNLEAILNLEPFLDADKSFDKSDFYPATLDQFTTQGQLWALPAEVTPYVIEYNRDLFDAAKVAYPKPGWTMDDFLATAKALTKGSGDAKQYGYVGDYYEANDLVLMLQALGAKLVDTTQDPPKAVFDDATMRSAMQWYADLHNKHDVKPMFVTDFSKLLTEATTALVERETMIDDGRAAMWSAYAGMPDLLGSEKRPTMNIGVAPLPIGATGPKGGNYVSSNGYYISADTSAKQACWKWITYLTSAVDVKQGLPARKSVATSEAYKQKVGAERADAYQASLGEGGNSSVYEFFSGKNSWLSYSIFWLVNAYGQVVDGSVPADKALADAQKLADDFRACVVQNKAESDTTQQRKCVKQVDPSIPGVLIGLTD
jgi:ABC-type glycerol-3-phosphate transport system substrate-binding protein